MSDERRKLERVQLYYYLKVFDRDTDKVVGRLVDITPEGLMLICESKLKPDTAYRFYMTLPDGFDYKRHVEFDAVCRWCKPDVNQKYYDAGFHLTRIDRRDKTLILDLMEDYRMGAVGDGRRRGEG